MNGKVKLAIGVSLVVAALGGLSAAASASTPPFRVSSTLDGRTVLPHHIYWIAHPSLPRPA